VSRNRRRAIAIAVAGVFAVAPMVSACAAGQHPQSALPSQLAEGVNASAHLVDIRNAFLLGPAPGERLSQGGSMPLYAWFVNRTATPDRLVAVEAPGIAGSVEIAGGAVTLPPGGLVATKQTAAPAAVAPVAPPVAPPKTPTPAASPAAPSSAVILRNLARPFDGGEDVHLTLHFQQAGVITLDVPVVTQDGYYATYSPAPAPAAPPAPTTQPTTPGSTPTPSTKSKTKTKTKKPSPTPSA
jgi:copper(I)-binding protein